MAEKTKHLKKSTTTEKEKADPKRPALRSRSSSARVSTSDILSQSWGTTWRKAVVSLPRAVPDAALRFTYSKGPYPFVIKMPSRDKGRAIQLYVFIPPSVTKSRSGSPTSKSAPKKPSKLNPCPPPPQTVDCPVLLDFHGGGFIFGSCQEQAPFCAKLSRDLSCIAISVDYRLGPYAKFPAAIHDAEDVLNAILHPCATGYNELRHSINAVLSKAAKPNVTLDTSRIALSGFSSGGSLALNLAMSLPKKVSCPPNPSTDVPAAWPSPIPPTHDSMIPTLLFYPALDTRLLPHERPLPPGMTAPKSFWSSLNLEGELMPTYLPKCLASHPRASPGLVSTSHESGILHSQVKSFVVLPEMDTLSASNELWVKRMMEEGRGEDMVVERVKGMLHGWTQFPDPWLSECAKAKKAEIFQKSVRFVRQTWQLSSETNSIRDSDSSIAGGSETSSLFWDDNRQHEQTQLIKEISSGVVDFEGRKLDLNITKLEWEARAAESY